MQHALRATYAAWQEREALGTETTLVSAQAPVVAVSAPPMPSATLADIPASSSTSTPRGPALTTSRGLGSTLLETVTRSPRATVAAGPGKAEHRRSVRLAERSVVEIDLPLNDSRAGAPARAVPRETTAQEPASASASNDNRILGLDRSTATYVALGVGGAGLLVGTITGLIGLQKQSVAELNCDDETKTCNQRGFDANATAGTMATVSMIGFVVGLAGAGAGTYLLVTTPAEDRHKHSASG
jgi:hypothetical protein